jgi:uncharacterized membrane protein YebE (DUF533 family)
MGEQVSESRFYMWRTLFALVHADNMVTEEEVRFMAEAMEDIPFSREQSEILMKDMRHPQDVTVMFANVTDVSDQAEFFNLARGLVHSDGDYCSQEQALLLKLKKAHMDNMDLGDLIGKVNLTFESDGTDRNNSYADADERGFAGLFKRLFSGRKTR